MQNVEEFKCNGVLYVKKECLETAFSILKELLRKYNSVKILKINNNKYDYKIIYKMVDTTEE